MIVIFIQVEAVLSSKIVRSPFLKAKIDMANFFISGIWLVGTIGRETGPIKPHLIACYVAVPFFITGVVNYSAVTFVGKTQRAQLRELVSQAVGRLIGIRYHSFGKYLV